MPYAYPTSSGYERLHGQSFAIDDVQYPANVIDLWSPEELAAIGVLAFTPAEDPPEGMAVRELTYELVDGQLHEVATYGPAPPPPVPEKVSRMQAKQALLAADLLDDIEEAIAASNDRALQLYWAETSEFHRDHPKVAEIATSLGWTQAQLDDLFRAAAQVV